jgi:uncharacterized protein YdhG (YjbR/CyaY superfamily)
LTQGACDALKANSAHDLAIGVRHNLVRPEWRAGCKECEGTEGSPPGRRTKGTAPMAKNGNKFSAEERAAMRERQRELKAQAANADGEAEVLAKIAEMPEADRSMGERIHAIVKQTAPHLVPRTWYGMPAYSRDGQVVCFFQAAAKFKARYATLGFSDKAKLDDGAMWPTSFALTEMTPEVDRKIADMVRRAIR